MGSEPDRPPDWVPPDPLPFPIETPRLLVDRYREEDAPSLFGAISTYRKALGVWLPWPAKDHHTVDETLDRIRSFRKETNHAHPENLHLGVFDASTREVLGGSGLHAIRAERGQAEIGYWIRPDRQGEGLCTEATAALVHAAFLDFGFRRILVRLDARNVPSRRVVEKVGFRLERTSLEAEWREGDGWRDELGFALLAHEWDPRRRWGPSADGG